MPRFLAAIAMMTLLGGAALAQDGFSYPPEWERQAATWIAWPGVEGPPGSPVHTLTSAQAATRLEMVRVLIEADNNVVLQTFSDAGEAEARTALEAAGLPLARVTFIRADVYDAFIRDIGPRFVTDGRTVKVADIPWKCYGYTRNMAGDYADECLTRETNDNQMAEAMGIETIPARAASEGGALEATSTLLMGYLDTALDRNPGMTKDEIEADYLTTYGKEKMVWLRTAPVSDRPGHKLGRFYGWGANGHVDEYARFVGEDTVVIAQVEDPTNPLGEVDQATLRENLADLQAARTVDGRPLTIRTMPAPDHALFAQEVRLDSPLVPETWVNLVPEHDADTEILFSPAVSYMNFVIANNVIIVPAYWQEGLPEQVKADDAAAAATLAEVFPGREVVQINPLAINWWGGGMHCSTQQQPAVAETAAISP